MDMDERRANAIALIQSRDWANLRHMEKVLYLKMAEATRSSDEEAGLTVISREVADAAIWLATVIRDIGLSHERECAVYDLVAAVERDGLVGSGEAG